MARVESCLVKRKKKIEDGEEEKGGEREKSK